ncbi:N-acetyltransferase ESCO, zinc-finger domain and N-acetyltransferase ESCO, acetyl-transferase domain-containing protein [Strongyloides ratti]|uniref:N-acetyltransferase ESCO, zinc-finger domain and N-acetyltransferase ESCO, acetyl-transferase domain-containing protein n=1 Tax=Strongyloides ratti TaxID=34506 RepID=A0A090KWG1_STRRB|nr:N-acetyltransferase ESCO, zinc-finger domain and N-acetyltransferase ESCO, acetyl-transferase domain-containing protein [Strongyloides ratti]CEF61845.1 N-acetyltransferase ESCO, zinc-finger domain and N-acetyltransferase ESCO, acetyl-transferase domain-containing protein [Strongyloides ratti]
MSNSNNLITNYFKSTTPLLKRSLPIEIDKCSNSHFGQTKIKRKYINDSDKRQQRLDFGQRNIGPIYCRDCEYVYEQTNPEDVKAHDKYHNRAFTVDAFKVTSKQLEIWKEVHFYKEDENKLYFHIKKTSKSTLIKKIEILLEETLNKELEEESKNIWGSLNTREGYVYIEKISNKSSYIGGIAFVEYFKEAKILKSFETVKGNFLGLYILWVHPLIRRKKIGTNLLDVIREIHLPLIYFSKDSFLIDHSTQVFEDFISSYTDKHISDILTFVT